jgi:serine phosphatase RsbU (regulator of sigma subunit)
MIPTTFSEHHVKLSSGSRLLFYSDGISESADASEEEYGLAHLQRLILRPGLTAERVLDDARSFAGKDTMRDDATVILVESRHELP